MSEVPLYPNPSSFSTLVQDRRAFLHCLNLRFQLCQHVNPEPSALNRTPPTPPQSMPTSRFAEAPSNGELSRPTSGLRHVNPKPKTRNSKIET